MPPLNSTAMSLPAALAAVSATTAWSSVLPEIFAAHLGDYIAHFDAAPDSLAAFSNDSDFEASIDLYAEPMGVAVISCVDGIVYDEYFPGHCYQTEVTVWLSRWIFKSGGEVRMIH
jgi:hypothetical protein